MVLQVPPLSSLLHTWCIANICLDIWQCKQETICFQISVFLFSRDHHFDKLPQKATKRKRGEISDIDKPTRGCKPIRSHHARDESKILPHIRQKLDIGKIWMIFIEKNKMQRVIVFILPNRNVFETWTQLNIICCKIISYPMTFCQSLNIIM